MLKNYLKTAFRNLIKYKLSSFINISGLAAGIACFILIFSFFYNEYTYDTFNVNAENIYRIYNIDKAPAGIEKKAETPDPLAAALRNDFPALEAASISSGNEFPVSIDGETYKEKIFEADPGIFRMFSFPFLKGNPGTALKDISSVVITEGLAKKYFGNENALGKTILLLNKYPLIISGILKKIPSNSSIQLNIVVSTELKKSLIPGYKEQWYSSGRFTFVKSSDMYPPAVLKSILPKIREKYLPDFLKERKDFGIQPLTAIHLSPEIIGGIVQPISELYLYLLLTIALSIIVIAGINFMNLTASRSSDRVKEISIRRVLGSKKYQFIFQFLSESILLSYAALFLGIAMAEMFLPEFKLLTGKDIEIFGRSFSGVVYLLSLGLFIGVLSGLYPAYLFASYSSTDKDINRFTPGGKINAFRKALMTVQFAISVILITCILVIGRQINFMKNYNLGFNKENIVVIPLDDGSGNVSNAGTYLSVINEKKQNNGIINAAFSEHIPGYYFNNEFGVIPEGFDKSQSIPMIVTSIDENFLKTYQLPVIEGRGFSNEFGSDMSDEILLNETAAQKMGWKAAVGKTISFAHGEGPYKVIGVVRDLHFKSLQNKIEPLVIRYAGYEYRKNFISVRVNTGNIPFTISYLKKQWQNIFPGNQFDYFFIDAKYNEAYKAEETTALIIGSFSLIAILLATLGLLGLTILTITQKTKEIGIRKVLGASMKSIFLLISKQFIKIILIADIIAFPAAYFLMSNWLDDYPYRITLDVSFFILSGLLVLFIALLTTGFQVLKAAKANPVESLKYE